MPYSSSDTGSGSTGLTPSVIKTIVDEIMGEDTRTLTDLYLKGDDMVDLVSMLISVADGTIGDGIWDIYYMLPSGFEGINETLREGLFDYSGSVLSRAFFADDNIPHLETLVELTFRGLQNEVGDSYLESCLEKLVSINTILTDVYDENAHALRFTSV